MKDGVSRVTSPTTGATNASVLAARVLADGLDAVADSVTHVLHGASGAARDRAERNAAPTRQSEIADGRAARWAGHKLARRDELIDSAITAIDLHGADISMDQVAAVAGTSKPVIYRYFVDKDDLCRSVSQRLVANGLSTLVSATAAAAGLRQVIAAGVDSYLGLLESTPEHFRFINQHPLIADPNTGTLVDFGTVVSELFAQHVRGALVEAGMDPALAHPWAEGTVGFIRAASLWWLDQPAGRTRAQLSTQLVALLWDGAGGVLAGGTLTERTQYR